MASKAAQAAQQSEIATFALRPPQIPHQQTQVSVSTQPLRAADQRG